MGAGCLLGQTHVVPMWQLARKGLGCLHVLACLVNACVAPIGALAR
jgi:hypothetical protein